MSFDKIVETIISLILLASVIPLLSTLYSTSNPNPQTIVDNTAIEQAKNLSAQLELCQKNYEELNRTILTKQDIKDLYSALATINQNVVNIYETNNNYIRNYFTFTIAVSLTLGFTLSVGLLTLFDVAFFNMELRRGFIRVVKKRFKR
jgi:hypothetical protein